MSEMADGIRPILDRLDEIEDRVIEMESGEEPVPADPRGWLNAELRENAGRFAASSIATGQRRQAAEHARHGSEIAADDRRSGHQAVPVDGRESCRKQIEEQHVRTLETFVKNIQVKLVQRVSVLEQNMSQQAEAMHQLREYNQRTEDNLSRLISGVDKLAQELPKRIAAAQAATAAEPPVLGAAEESRSERAEREPERASRCEFFAGLAEEKSGAEDFLDRGGAGAGERRGGYGFIRRSTDGRRCGS